MVPFKATASLVAIAAFPVIHGFTSRAPHATSATQLGATDETFQRSLLEARLANHAAPIADDVPAANDVEDPEAAPPAAAAVDNASTQNSILRIAASTDRGQFATPSQSDAASRLLAELESNAPAVVGSALEGSAGTWELLYSNTQLFRSSPFFLAGRSTCRTKEEAERYDWFCDMHRAALAISTIGAVRQVIARDGRLVNEFEVKAGAVPFLSDFVPFAAYSGGLPFTIDGAIVSTADATQTAPDEWQLYMDTVEIKGSNVPLLRNVLDAENVALRSRDLSDFLEGAVDAYETPRPVLRTTFLDGSMRIVRDEDDNVFVYGRVSDSEEPTDYSSVMADLGVASLLEGFNDAIAKIYL